MELRSQIKINARLAIKKEWGRAVAILMIITAVQSFFVMLEALCYTIFDIKGFVDVLQTQSLFYDDLSNTSLISFLITGGSWILAFIILTPLLMGQAGWYFSVIENKRTEVYTLFCYYEKFSLFIKSLYIQLNLSLRKLFWAVLFFIPSGAVFFACYQLTASGKMTYDQLPIILMAIMGILLVLLSSVLYFIFISRYVLVPYLYAEDHSTKTRHLVKNSVRAMRGRRTQLFEFYISFIPWFLSCLLILPILYVWPYFLTAKALYSKYFIEAYRRSRKQDKPVVEQPREPLEDENFQGEDID